MIFHRLRVISFSKSLLSIKSLSKIQSDEVKHAAVVSDVEVSMPQHVPSVPQKKEDPEENTPALLSKISLDRMLGKRRLQFKSQSEIVMISSRKPKQRTARKTLSLNDIKRRLSQTALNSKRARKTHQKPFKKENIRKKNKSIPKEHDVKVLYVAGSKPPCRRRSRQHRTLNMPQSSCDIFGFHKKKTPIKLHTFYHRYNIEDNPFRKLRIKCAQRIKKPCEPKYWQYTHQPVKVVTSSINNREQTDTTCCSDARHYNVVRFPQNTNSSIHRNNSIRWLYDKKVLVNELRRSYSSTKPRARYPVCVPVCAPRQQTHGQTITPSILKVSTCGGTVPPCRSGNRTSKVVINDSRYCKSSLSKHESLKCASTRSMRKFPFLVIYHKIYNKVSNLAAAIYAKRPFPWGILFKYILLILVMIAWSPCLLCLGTVWLCSNPLRLQHVVNDKDKAKYTCNDECFYSQCQYDWWTKFVIVIKRMSKATKSVFSPTLLPKVGSRLDRCSDRECLHSDRCVDRECLHRDRPMESKELPRSFSHPDPCRKYTLYHDECRGWVIKPIHRQQSEPVTTKNKFKQVFHHLFFNCDHSKIVQHSGAEYKTNATSEQATVGAKEDDVCLREQRPKLLNSIETDKTCVEEDEKVCLSPSVSKGRKKRHQIAKLSFEEDKKVAQDSALSKPHRKLARTYKPCLEEDKNVCLTSSLSKPHKNVTQTSKTCVEEDKNVCLTPTLSKPNKNLTRSSKPCVKIDERCIIQSESQENPKIYGQPFKKKSVPYRPADDKSHLSPSQTCKHPCTDLVIKKILSCSEIAPPDETQPCPPCETACIEEKIPEACHSCKPSVVPVCRSKTVFDKTLGGRETSELHSISKSSTDPARRRLTFFDKLLGNKIHGNQITMPIIQETPKNIEDTVVTPAARICNKSVCSDFLKSTRRRSVDKFVRPEPKSRRSLSSTPVPSRSILKTSSSKTKRSKYKPDRITITETGQIKRKPVGPQKIINIKISSSRNTQTSRRRSAPKTASPPPHVLEQPRSRYGKQLPSKNPCRCKRWRENVVCYIARIVPSRKKITIFQRVKCCFRCFGRACGNFDKEIASTIFPIGVTCKDRYLATMRQRPCFWVYGLCPSSYPDFLRWYYCSKIFCFHCVVSISACFWAPIMLWCCICYQLSARCCSCFC